MASLVEQMSVYDLVYVNHLILIYDATYITDQKYVFLFYNTLLLVS